jgi:hypothetical protein
MRALTVVACLLLTGCGGASAEPAPPDAGSPAAPTPLLSIPAVREQVLGDIELQKQQERARSRLIEQASAGNR